MQFVIPDNFFSVIYISVAMILYSSQQKELVVPLYRHFAVQYSDWRMDCSVNVLAIYTAYPSVFGDHLTKRCGGANYAVAVVAARTINEPWALAVMHVVLHVDLRSYTDCILSCSVILYSHFKSCILSSYLLYAG